MLPLQVPPSGESYAGLGENNGSLPLGGWLKVTCGLTGCTPWSAPCPTLGNEYERTLYLYLALSRCNKRDELLVYIFFSLPYSPGGANGSRTVESHWVLPYISSLLWPIIDCDINLTCILIAAVGVVTFDVRPLYPGTLSLLLTYLLSFKLRWIAIFTLMFIGSLLQLRIPLSHEQQSALFIGPIPWAIAVPSVTRCRCSRCRRRCRGHRCAGGARQYR